MSNKDTNLAKPMKIGPRTAPNRFVINAMECCDATPDGGFSERSLERYWNLAKGQAGVVVFESITMQYDSRARDMQIALRKDNPTNIEEWRKFIKDFKALNPDSLLIVQLNHSGEISGGGDQKRVCVKPLHGFGGDLVTDEYVDNTIDEFVEASKILYDLGADGVDLKFCHGYFGSQILRPYNDRKWKYGGAWENRSRFAFDMTEKVRKLIPDENFLIGSKVSMWEGFPGGQGSAGPDTAVMDLTESLDLCKGLEERGASFILESTGAPSITMALHMPEKGKADDVYLHFSMANWIKKAVSKDMCVMGGAYSVLNKGKNTLQAVQPEWNSMFHWGNYNIEKGYCDMIALGRQSLADPLLPKKYLEDKEDDIKWCTACDSCVELLIRQQNVGCVVHNKPYTQILKDVRAEKGRLRLKVT
ncbi:2,4-dienoyl-CoA reductase [Christensenellaceae bacterium OttesenSCG-928-K19]|nr:2,4-dienoyl-CoA reductase [Christensenellaceae bacterium OttesenSCG-928-K19]